MARILVIEDDAGVRAYIEAALASVGHRALFAANGKEGIDIYRANPADVVLTDIFMPVKDGLETIMELRRDFPQSVIIAMSGDAGAGSTLAIALQLGAAAVLDKPFFADQLLQVIDRVLVPDLRTAVAAPAAESRPGLQNPCPGI